MLIIENDTDKLDLLRYAIENKYAISFWYVGKDYKEKKKEGQNPKQNWRRVEPFALGKTKKGGWLLRAYQYGGVTNSKSRVYKTFSVDEIKDGSVSIMYDKTGKKLQTFEPKTYIDSRGEMASFRSDGSDKSMSGGVDKYYNINTPAGSTDNTSDITAKKSKPVSSSPTIQKPKPVIKPKAAVKPNPNEPPIPVQASVSKKVPNQLPKLPIEPDSEPEEIEPVKINPQTLEPEEKDAEWETEPINEVKQPGFLKWILNLNKNGR